jgi:hypothetical protein
MNWYERWTPKVLGLDKQIKIRMIGAVAMAESSGACWRSL